MFSFPTPTGPYRIGTLTCHWVDTGRVDIFSTEAAGLTKPGLWITRDAQRMRLERQRAGGWPEAEIEAHQAAKHAAYSGSSSAAYFVQLPGAFQANFMDVSLWSPRASLFGIAGPIDGRRAHDIINAFLLAFFNRHLKGRAQAWLEAPTQPFAEVILESRKPGASEGK